MKMSTKQVRLKEAGKNKKYEQYWHIYYAKVRVGKIYTEKRGESDDLWINMFINQALQGKGIGSAALNQVSVRLADKPLFAEIKKTNIASQKAFRKVGFKSYKENAAGQDILIRKAGK
ncbi:MAG: Acetyltransferase domain [Candidatus Parcubacteria bacterium]